MTAASHVALWTAVVLGYVVVGILVGTGLIALDVSDSKRPAAFAFGCAAVVLPVLVIVPCTI